MAIRTYEGVFMTGVGAPGTNVVVTGLGFRPELVLFWTCGKVSTAEDLSQMSGAITFGFAIDSTHRGNIGSYCGDNHVQPYGSYWQDGSWVVSAYAEVSGPACRGRLDFVSMDADGFTCIIDTTFNPTYCIHFLAIAGYSHYACGFSAVPGATGNQVINALGFKPCGVLFGLGWGNLWDQANGFYSGMGMGLGAADDTGHQWVMATQSDGNVGIHGGAYGYDAECMARVTSGAATCTDRATFVSCDADGFTINWLERASGSVWFWIALGGPAGSFLVGNAQTRMDGLDIPVGTGFTPSGIFFSSVMLPKHAADTPSALVGFRLTEGAASSVALRSTATLWVEDSTSPTDVDTAQYTSEVYASMTNVPAADGLMDVKSFDPTGFTNVMDDPEAAAAFFGWAVFGPANWESKRRVVTYTRDTMDPDPRLKDSNGVYLDPWECHADAWVKFLGVFSPTTNMPASLVDDPEAGYIEELGWDSESEGPKFFTSRMDLGETVIAQAAAKAGA